jgi:effector-binding domain-containing protein
MSYEVRVIEVAARPTIVVKATTSWKRFPSVWKEMLDEVWTCLRAGGIDQGCRNIMLYLDDVPHVEVGVELLTPCPLTGRVTASNLPGGRVATTLHRGSYNGLASAHQAVRAWCAAAGEEMSGVLWEVYGHNHNDVSQVWTEIYWFLAR